jgi:hypothetical protein
MAITRKKLETMLEEIGNSKKVIDDTLIPQRDERSKAMFGLSKNGVGMDEVYVAELMEAVGCTVEEDDKDDKYNSILDLLHQLIFEEAYKQGNKENGALAVKVSAYSGDLGKVFRIEDSGRGFNFSKRIRYVREMIKKRGEDYVNEEKYEEARVMAILMLEDDFIEASYDKKGSSVNVMIKE